MPNPYTTINWGLLGITNKGEYDFPQELGIGYEVYLVHSIGPHYYLDGWEGVQHWFHDTHNIQRFRGHRNWNKKYGVGWSKKNLGFLNPTDAKNFYQATIRRINQRNRSGIPKWKYSKLFKKFYQGPNPDFRNVQKRLEIPRASRPIYRTRTVRGSGAKYIIPLIWRFSTYKDMGRYPVRQIVGLMFVPVEKKPKKRRKPLTFRDRVRKLNFDKYGL